jgi:hypothetical protein
MCTDKVLIKKGIFYICVKKETLGAPKITFYNTTFCLFSQIPEYVQCQENQLFENY